MTEAEKRGMSSADDDKESLRLSDWRLIEIFQSQVVWLAPKVGTCRTSPKIKLENENEMLCVFRKNLSLGFVCLSKASSLVTNNRLWALSPTLREKKKVQLLKKVLVFLID